MPPQLGCNYSRPLLDLLGQGKADVYWIKLSRPPMVEEELAQARPVRPVLLHTLGAIGQRPELWESYPWTDLQRHLQVAGSPHIALHLEMRATDWDAPVDLRWQGREQAQAMLARFASAICTASRHLAIPLLLENIPYYGTQGTLRITVQPEAIWQLVEETGVGLLLDTSHLRCTAYHLGVDVHAYTRSLPLQAVREIHIAGPRLLPEYGLRDRHLACQSEDLALLAWLLEHTEPAIVTLEYGGTGPEFENEERNDPQALERQLVLLQQMLRG